MCVFWSTAVTSAVTLTCSATAPPVATSRRFCAIVAWPGDEVMTALSSARAAEGKAKAATSDAARTTRDGCFILAPGKKGKGKAGRGSGRGGLPAGARVEGGHLLGDRGRARAEVLLEDRAVLVDDERHDAALAVLRRIRDHREAGEHAAIDDVVVGAAGCRRALPGKDAEVVAEVRVALGAPREVGGAL